MIAILVAAFMVSGAAGLVYESIWSRYLGLFVGHSAYAQIIVLVIFLGGMSLGAHLVGRWSGRIRAPLLWYAAVEVVVGILAILFHGVFGWATTVAYDVVFPSVGGFALTAVKWLIAGALILPQSVLLGATFPLMSAGAIRVTGSARAPGRILGLLYFANSLGAAMGVLFAGFVLIQRVGLSGTLLVAGFLNVVAALVVGVVGRAHERHERGLATASHAEAGGHVAPAAPADDMGASLWRPLLLVSFGTAVASFIYEIAWIRMLSLVLGSATHSFELMLSAFIFGLALGALWIRSRADAIANPVRYLGIIQWTMGVLAVATLPLYVASFGWVAGILETVQQNEKGYQVFLAFRYAIALLIMLPATFCAGMTLPLITKVLMRRGGERAIGAVYAVNTVGSIAGVVLAGLVLMPLIGVKGLVIAGAVIDILLGIWLVHRVAPRAAPAADTRAARASWRHASPLTLPLALTAVFLAAVALLARFDLGRLTSGVYRHGVVSRASDYDFLYYKDGRTASVSVRRGVDGFTTLATNGKPDASMDAIWMDSVPNTGDERWQLTRDIATQLLLPIITLAHAPDAANMAVIGHGSGMSSHVLLGSPTAAEVVTIEIEPEMIAASRHFHPANARVFEDPRSTFVVDDAKSYFAASGRRFDLILSEPSNPWVSGVSGLFTVEFYERVQRQLAPGGVFGQWLHLYELSDGLVTSVLSAIDSVFQDYEVFFTSSADILVVASNSRVPLPDWDVIRYPGIEQDLRPVVPMNAALFESLRLGGRPVLRPLLLAHGVPNSDYYPILDLGAERMRFMRETASGYINLHDSRFDVMAALSGRRMEFGLQTFTATPEVVRSAALALGARIRALRELPADVASQVPRDGELRAAVYRQHELERVMEAPQPPADWHAWMVALLQADADLHGGTAGVVDSAFYSRARAFTTRAGAPAEARAAVDFLEGIGSWNWPRAVVSAGMLIASEDSLAWIPDAMLRNGAAVAHIRLGNYDGAKEVLREFARRTGDDPFTDRLIGAYLIYADTTLRREMGWQ